MYVENHIAVGGAIVCHFDEAVAFIAQDAAISIWCCSNRDECRGYRTVLFFPKNFGRLVLRRPNWCLGISHTGAN